MRPKNNKVLSSDKPKDTLLSNKPKDLYLRSHPKDIYLKSNDVQEIDFDSPMDLKSNQLNLIQTLLMVATATLLLPTVAIMGVIPKSPEGMVSALNILLSIITICSILFACILLSRIEGKIRHSGGN